MDSTTNDKRGSLPFFIHLGFAGSRVLYSASLHTEVDAAAFQAAVDEYLESRLNQLKVELGIEQCRVCGISSLAVGADFAFARICGTLRYLHRIFLPQLREEFLAAQGESSADFSPEEQAEAVRLLAEPNVIEERVVGTASDRTTRFQETNLEIARHADVVVCLVRDDGVPRAGGTAELIELAKQRGRPVLEICLGVKNGLPEFSETWHNRERFDAPVWPCSVPAASLSAATDEQAVPTVKAYTDALKLACSQKAKSQRRIFTAVAWIILGTHVLATVLAVLALQLHGGGAGVWLLGTEFVLLATGYLVHQHLHHSDACQAWAISRLLAELARSISSIAMVRVSLDYLFALPFPSTAKPFLTSLQVLHLHSTRGKSEEWDVIRKKYLDERLRSERTGQIGYYNRCSETAKRGSWWFHTAFIACSVAAIIATLLKIITHGWASRLPAVEELTDVLGTLAIVLPVLAVAALSLTAALDLQAREHTFREMHAFLVVNAERIETTKLEIDFVRLVQETEIRLLGEMVNWYSRRSFTGVT